MPSPGSSSSSHAVSELPYRLSGLQLCLYLRVLIIIRLQLQMNTCLMELQGYSCGLNLKCFIHKCQEITIVKAAYPRISKTGLKYLSGGYWKLYSTKLYPKETCQIWSPFLWGINACEWEHTWLSVNVPVLSVQIVVAEPIVSQAESLRTCISNGVNKSHI